MTVGLYFWAFIQNFILGAAIAALKRDGPNYLLASVFALTGLNVLTQYIFHFTNLKFTLARIIWIPDIIDFVVPSLLLLYLMRVLNASWPRRVYLYFLPAALTLAVLIPYVLFTPDFGFFDYIRTNLHRAVLIGLIVWKSFILYRGYRLLRRHREALRRKSVARFRWPALLCVFLFASALLSAINFVHMSWLAPYRSPESLVHVRQLIQFIFVSFNSMIVLGVIYYLVQHPKILSGKPMLKTPAPAPAREERDRHRERLLAAVEGERVFLDNELNEKRLAEHLDLPPYALSRLLNEELGKSFSTFINEYRIAEARRVLATDVDKQKTNFAIALESGFRSESVFYVNFKKFTGTTPSRYRKQLIREELTDSPAR
jgi:AraC-like DNA-binding protein